MGFNKRYLKETLLIEKFEKDGVKGIINYIGKSNALFTNSEKVDKILKILDSKDYETKMGFEIKKIIKKNVI